MGEQSNRALGRVKQPRHEKQKYRRGGGKHSFSSITETAKGNQCDRAID